MKPYIKLLRPHHWSKNFLIFLPALAGGFISHSNNLTHLLLGFLLFSLCASCGYIVNDILDVKNDRKHYRKKFRPVASGAITVSQALFCFVTGLLIVAVGAFLLDPSFFILLCAYFLTSLTYSFLLKRIFLIDIITLVALYLCRIGAGLILSPAFPTVWLFVFISLLFLSLACLKRYSEVTLQISLKNNSLPGRGYSTKDGFLLRIMGYTTGLGAAATLIVYTQSDSVSQLYSTPEWLFMLPLALTMWLLKAWALSQNNKIHSDPIVYTMKDASTYIAAVVCISSILLARY